ncbi:MAG: hypothetical protein ABJN34_05040 [Litoreibacter sp.]|uniref:hypothetical protein n=1 Tax=Litoreibacter sp. TaxID=1969459 RepID=UPI003298E92D
MRLVLVLLVAMASPMAAHASKEDSVVNATLMCKWLDSLDLLSGKCVVAHKTSAVDVRMDTSKSDANDICKTIVSTLRGDGVKFDKGWKLRIAAAKGGGGRLAQCNL